ncbi:MAG: glycosyltransferase family 9 protein [Paludibacteraceae bacterium]|nr:glycosyltransferase family 9 protein [Paludibacteraceae bacterium]
MIRILVIRFSALGDVAMLVPVVRALAEQYPDTEITMLSRQRMADLYADMPHNVHFLGVDTKKESLREIINRLGKYDYVADMHGVWRSLYIRWCMRLRGAHVATLHKGRIQKWMLTHGWIRKPLVPMIERYADVLRRIGFPILLPQPSISTSGEGIGIAPFAAHRGKIYPIDKMEQVVKLLRNRGEKVVLFGAGEKEISILQSWVDSETILDNTRVNSGILSDLKRMKNLRVMLTMDSANMHLASLAGTRVISIWGATHPNAGFLGFGQKESDCIQHDMPCRPCSIYGNKKCKYGDYRCLDITPEEIVNKLLETK